MYALILHAWIRLGVLLDVLQDSSLSIHFLHLQNQGQELSQNTVLFKAFTNHHLIKNSLKIKEESISIS